MRKRPNSKLARQRGVALLTVLLVLTTLATLMIYSAEDQSLAIRRGENQILSEQGFQVNVSGEQWVVKILEKDIANDIARSNENQGFVDHTGEIWGNLGPPVEVGETGTTLLMSIEDLQGKFNLNNLIQGKPPARDGNQNPDDGEARSITWYEVFQRILNAQSIEPTVADSLLDWIDQNEESSGVNGAEDFFYSGLEVPYRAANRPLTSLSEIQRINGFDTSTVEKLLPLTTAIPVRSAADLSKINVNSASASLLGAFAADFPLNSEALDRLIVSREREPFLSLEDFVSRFSALAPGGLVPGYAAMLSVSSGFYAGNSCAESGRVKFSMTSVMQKQTTRQNVKVLSRERYFGCPFLAKLNSSAQEQVSE